jgi:hypothetical protein
MSYRAIKYFKTRSNLVKKSLPVFFLILSLLNTQQLFARPIYFNELSAQTQGAANVQKCLNCHNQGGLSFNAFGNDYVSIFRRPNTVQFPGIDKMTRQQLWDLLLNSLDSNKNGVSNLLDIKSGKNPGTK